jgi:lysyl-tRNA synthetase class 2
MASLEELRNTRLEKIKILKEFGMDPYPVSSFYDLPLSEIKINFNDLMIKKNDELISTIGRVIITRGQGAILFIVLQDGGERLQAVLKKDEVNEELFNLFTITVDNGDYISVTGNLFITTRGEQSILIKKWSIATKALLPLPDKWHGLQDIEETYRKRYLDIIMDNEVYNRFIIRAKVIKYIKKFFEDKNFLEVETPILQSQAGGAMARVFETHHNDFDMPVVLRIALELEHKIIMAGGYKGVFEIGKCFRNEGSDPTHIQEFTMLEWYSAFDTLEKNMEWTEDLIKNLAKEILGKENFDVSDKEGNIVSVSFANKWPIITFGSLLKENANIDIENITKDEAIEESIKWGMEENEARKIGRGNLLDFIYKKSSRYKIIDPTFIINFPGDLKPLAQQNEDGTAKVCQLIIAGAEISNQYAELVDPIRQRELLISQTDARKGGDEEAMEIDERFLEAMEHGMPPMTGFGMGIDRIVAILTEQKNLRDTIFFPLMKPRE